MSLKGESMQSSLRELPLVRETVVVAHQCLKLNGNSRPINIQLVMIEHLYFRSNVEIYHIWATISKSDK